MNEINKAIEWAVNIANDNTHGYDQIGRWGPDYDCSSLIISAWQQAGVPVMANGATYTGNMRIVFERCGFTAISCKKGMPTLCRGDVLLNEKHHTCMFIGDGKIVQASINEKGGIYNGKDGDQTGKEIAVGPYYTYSKGWDYVLRYNEKQEDKTVDVTMPVLQKGSRCAEVGTVQVLLNQLGYRGANGLRLTIDHDYGKNVEFAVKNFQKACGLGQDGIVGVKTWPALLKANY